jgi:TonB family protein
MIPRQNTKGRTFAGFLPIFEAYCYGCSPPGNRSRFSTAEPPPQLAEVVLELWVAAMSILKTIVPKPSRPLAAQLRGGREQDRRQRQLMIGSLCILVLALGILLWHDRDFWVPPDDADVDQPAEIPPPVKTETAKVTPAPLVVVAPTVKTPHKVAHFRARVSLPSAAPVADSDDQSGITVTSRTVLPPLDVEVVAGNTHRVVKPGNNALHVDLRPPPPQPAPEAANTETAAGVTSNATERIEMSPNTSTMVSAPVGPSYPLLARQMKVQGRVVLMAFIRKDGIIQNLRVISGPPILASAAEDAVRQWHFKPHIEGTEAVETQAKITVNFTISTN